MHIASRPKDRSTRRARVERGVVHREIVVIKHLSELALIQEPGVVAVEGAEPALKRRLL